MLIEMHTQNVCNNEYWRLLNECPSASGFTSRRSCSSLLASSSSAVTLCKASCISPVLDVLISSKLMPGLDLHHTQFLVCVRSGGGQKTHQRDTL